MKYDKIVIANKKFNSRLIVGTGKYKSMSECARFFDCSPARISCNVKGQKYYNGIKHKDKVWIISRA